MNAAVSAGDIAQAMARVNYSAQSAGISMNTLIGMLTVGQEVSQRAPEEVGNAWRTVISRMQNVKAGKFTANYSDMDSSDYNEEDWAALNDVETVLKTVGVTMRETATSWRSDEEVLNEVASKWSSFDDVTRSAIANAMAGTRQREQFILMMQNWESVQDYAEMAANSYGAATQKMEAYTNSIEAAKNRVTSAWEEISLNLDLNGRIAGFYDIISFLVENLTTLAKTLILLGIAKWIGTITGVLKKGTGIIAGLPALTGRIQAFGKSISDTTSGLGKLIYNSIIKSNADEQEAQASRNAASADNEEAAASRESANAAKLNKYNSVSDSIGNTVAAVGSVAGGVLGAQSGATIGEQLGGDTGKTVGGTLGSVIGTGLVSIGAIAGKAFATAKFTSALGSAIAPGLGTLVGAAVGVGINLITWAFTAKKEKETKEKIEAAQDEFKETTSTLSEVQGVKKYAKTIDDLRSGVDSFGNNLALTEEEYAEFLEANNQIASTMPSLVSHYDENGNAILNLGQVTDSTTGKVKTLSDVISEEIDRLSREADRKLVSEEIFGENLKTAKEKLEEAKEETQEKRTELNEEANSLFERENQLKAKKLYGVTPEESAQIDKELKDVITRRDQIQAELDALNNSDEASEVYSDELSENVNAALRRNSNYSNLTTDQQAIIQRAVMANAEEIIGAESTNEAIDIINNTVDAASDFFNSEGGKAALTNLTSAENATTAREQYDNRILVGEWLNGKKNLTDADIAIAKAYGYEYKNGQFTDNENIIQNILRAYGVKDTNALGGGAAKYLSNLSPDDARQFIKYGNQGLSFETSKKVFAVDSLNANTYDGAIELIKTFASFNMDDVEAYFKTIQSGVTITAEEVAEKFPMVPEETRNAIQTAAQDIADSEKITAETVSEAMDDVNSAIDAQLTNVVNSANKMTLKDWFTSDWDTNDNGIIDTFKELKNVLDELAESYDKLKDAQEEQNSMGHLSFQTALDLVTSNEAYLNCLHVENGQIKLNTNAKKTLALAQMEAAQSSLDEMRANLMKEASDIASALSTGTLTETTNGEIEASAEAVKASNDNATAVATEGKVALATALAISKLNKARQGKENLTDKEYKKLLKEVEDSTEEERVETEITAQTVSNGLTAEQRAAYEKRWKAITGKDWSDNGANDVYAMEEAFQNGNDKAYTTQGYTGLLGISGAISQTLAKSIKEEDVSGWIENYETPSGDAKEAWERIKDIISAVNKEYQQMVASSKEFADNSKQISTNLKDYLNNMSTQYYDALEVMYNKELKALAANQYFGLSLTEINNANFSDDELSDALEVYKETQEVQTKLAGLDNEKVQDKIDILETQGEINDAIIAEYRNLVKTADNTAQRIEYEEKLNEKLREQVELTKTLKQYQKKIYDFELQYESGTPDSQKYKTLMKESKENLEEQMEDALAAAKVAYDNAYNDAYSDYIAAGYSEAVAKSKAAEEAEKNSDYQSSMEDYMEAYQAIGDLIMQEYNDHINVLQRKMTELENSKPNEWASDWDENNTKVVTSAIDKMKEYYNELESYYSDMANQAYETLTKHAKELTDEQVQELTEKYNEAMKNIRDNAVTLHEQIKTYQESVYSALTAEVNRYKEQLEKQKELTEDAYDKELEKLNDKNEAIERTNKLLELQQNLLNANKEKEKVYRQGIGWTYESNRNKVKEAQTALDDFYRQDTIDDLTAAKEAELNNFEERIKNWDDYLEMLQSRYEEYDRLQEQKLLKELLGVDSQEAVEEIIKTDMVDFTTYMDEHLTDFFDNQITAFGNFNSIFGEFLDEYKKNLETLNGLNTQEVDTISADSYLGKNSTTVPDVTKTVKIKKTDQSLYDIVLNDAELLSGKKASNIDANGYYDYAANLATAAKSGDISEAIYQAVLRDVKIVNDSEYEKYADKDRTDTLYSYSKLEAALKSNSSLSSQQITTALKTYQTAQTNAQNVASAIANANLQVDSETSQAAIQLSTYLPVQLSEQQATQLATQMEGNAAIQSLLSDSSNVLSDKIGETTTTVEKTNAAIDAVTTLISGYFKTKEEAEAAAKSYVSSSSGGGGGGGGNSNASIIAQMKANSTAWHSADADTQKSLADKNASLGASLGWTRDSSGTWYDSSGKKAYAEGIENGPVTYTGLAMLHGTPTSPEYVLNSDQAYNLLKYMSTKKPEFTSNANTSSGDNWNLSGDIILENCNDPAQFWNEVTKAMSNRFNVTKNRR